MAYANLCIELDSLGIDFPWDQLEKDPLGEAHYGGTDEDEQGTECHMFCFGGEWTLNEIGTRMLGIISLLDRLRGLRLSEDEWWIELPKKYLGIESSGGS